MPTLRFNLMTTCLCLATWAMVDSGGSDGPGRMQRFDQPPRAKFLINAALTGTTLRAQHFAGEQLAHEVDASLRDPSAYYQ